MIEPSKVEYKVKKGEYSQSLDKPIKKGTYQHFKSKEMVYEVIGEAYNSETLEVEVVYKALYDNHLGFGTLFARPKKMFLEMVEFEGKVVPRFKKIKDSE